YLPWLLPSLFRMVGVPVVQTWHGYDSRRMSRRFIPNSVLAGGLIVVRQEYIDQMEPLYRWLNRRKHVRFIPNGSTVALFPGSVEIRGFLWFCVPGSRS